MSCDRAVGKVLFPADACAIIRLHQRAYNGGKRRIQIKVDAQQPDDLRVLAADGDRRGMHGLALFVFRIIGDIVLAVVVADILQHMQRKIGDWRAFLAAGIVAVDDLDNGIIVVFQTVQNDLIPVPR